jgi:hypothetical protein
MESVAFSSKLGFTGVKKAKVEIVN